MLLCTNSLRCRMLLGKVTSQFGSSVRFKLNIGSANDGLMLALQLVND